MIGEFNPGLYRDGWNRIFGEIARRLEPPHVAELRAIVAESEKSKRRWDRSCQRQVSSVTWPLVRELEVVSLVRAVGNGANVNVFPTDAAERFLEFLWGYEDPLGTTAGS